MITLLMLPVLFYLTLGLAGCLMQNSDGLPMALCLMAAIVVFGVVFGVVFRF